MNWIATGLSAYSFHLQRHELAQDQQDAGHWQQHGPRSLKQDAGDTGGKEEQEGVTSQVIDAPRRGGSFEPEQRDNGGGQQSAAAQDGRHASLKDAAARLLHILRDGRGNMLNAAIGEGQK